MAKKVMVTWDDGVTYEGESLEVILVRMWIIWQETARDRYVQEVAQRAQAAYGIPVRWDSAEHLFADLESGGVVKIHWEEDDE